MTKDPFENSIPLGKPEAKRHRPQASGVEGDVRYWHLVADPIVPAFVRYWRNSGHSDVSTASEWWR
jgi:hypothetical protein